MTDPSKYAEMYRSEAREHLGTVNRLLLVLERHPERKGVLEELFRSLHTLKGSSAAMGYEVARELAHGLEHLLARMREGSVRADAATVDLLLQGADSLEHAIENPAESAPPVILDRLGAYAQVEESSEPPPRGEQTAVPDGAGPGLKVTVRLDPQSALPSARAILALRAARALGEVVDVVPSEAEIHAGKVEGSFRFVMPEEVDAARLEAAVRRVGEIDTVTIERRETKRAVGAVPEARAVRVGPIVRVPQVRLDSLVDQVGELMIARDRLRRAAGAEPGSELEEALDGVSRLIDDVREETLRLRMVPVGEVFDRFPRMVRDAARSLDRQVDLEISGREEEVDRGLLNEVADLLVHLLRNAIDHGIEPPAERVAAGKPPAGRIRLSAAREGPTVRIEVSDDGRGLQRERILAAAAARGLLEPSAGEPSESDLWGLLTTAGFSTRDRVTDVSGRGVGLDMVRSRAQALGGSLEIRSEPGRGASFALRLPLSLTLVRALRFEAGGAFYSVPVSAVVEVAEVAEPEAGMLQVRDARLPALDLRELFAGGDGGGEGGADAVIVVEFGGVRTALIVGGLEGQHQAVVKPFDAPQPMLAVFSGATILPDGRPSLILDPARITALAAVPTNRSVTN